METRQEKPDNIGSLIHEPNLCIFNQRCSNCMNWNSERAVCDVCGNRQFIMKNNCIELFIQHVLNQRKCFKHVVALAHNSQSFDCQFVLKYILEKTTLKPELILRGSKIILLSIDNLRFIDSLNYFPMRLADLPKAFDLLPSFKKGYFPHLFNRLENQKYIGPMPSINYYSPDTMKVEDRNIFLNWYEEHKNNTFNFETELVEYCRSDVEILTQACLKFREIMIQECKVCPFVEATTIASTCNLVYRRSFLEPNTIGIISKGGYRMVNTQSKEAIKWLIYEAEKRGIEIKHAGNSKEVIIHKMVVDGYCQEKRQVFEFHGCYFHGHECITANRDKPLKEDSADTLNARSKRTKEKTERLRKAGYEVIEMYGCQHKSVIPDTHPLLSSCSLNPRDAFYGGRTDNIVTYYKVKQGEKIKYLDFCSLYPFICKYGRFPVGHPKLHIGNEECSKIKLDSTNGLIKCKILPPRDLFHLVLPLKMNNKLMFVLCRTCGQSFSSLCSHTEDERALVGTWIIDEVNLALKKGYEMQEVYEIWEYKVSQLGEGSLGLFGSFMNKFLKIKQEASGWPPNCISTEQQHEYMKEYFEREGIELEKEKIQKNSGLRSLSKLMLNSFWGKFGQCENQPKTTIIRQPSEFFAMLANPSIDINFVQEIGEEVIIVNWEHKEESFDLLSTINVCIAAFTTGQARIKLYTCLEMLGQQMLYFDTDSVLFISKEGMQEPSVGPFLGDLTDELEEYGPGSYITEFVSGGPKNYSYTVWSPSKEKKFIKCKVKGFTLNYEATKLINFESMKRLILTSDLTGIPIIRTNIRRSKNLHVLSTRERKIYKPTSKKRKFLEDHSSIPYGHKKACKEFSDCTEKPK